MLETLLQNNVMLKLLLAAFLAILFLQSGIDKVIDWKGNLGWLKGHFENSPLKNVVPLLLGVITLTEIGAGALGLAGIGQLLLNGTASLAFWGAVLSAANLVMLFFGQRMAKDYEGAASLVNYFILSVLAILILQ